MQEQKIHEIQKRICQIKSSEKMGVKYMQEWEEKIIERQKALEEGQKVGEERITTLFAKLAEQNRIEDITKAAGDSAYLEELCQEFGL